MRTQYASTLGMRRILGSVVLVFAIALAACTSTNGNHARSSGDGDPLAAPGSEPRCLASGAPCRYEDDCCSGHCLWEEKCGG